MKTRAEAASLLHALAEPRPVGDSVKVAINRAAMRVSQFLQEPMRYGRAEDIWRQEARRISAVEMDALRTAAAERERTLAEQGCALAEVADSLERLAAGLAAGEARVDPDQLRRAAREARQSARALGRLADARPEG